MAAPTLTELQAWARVPRGVEEGPLGDSLATAVKRVRDVVGLSDTDDYPDTLKAATMILATHYFEDRSGLMPEPNVGHLIPGYSPVNLLTYDED